MPEQTHTRTFYAPQAPAKPLAPLPTRHRVRDDYDKPRDLWRPVAGQTALFDLNAPVQLALFDVPVDVLAEGAL